MSTANGADFSGQPVAWRPDPGTIDRARVLDFARQHGLSSFDELLARSIEDPDWYWAAVVEHLDIDWTRPYGTVLDTSAGIEWPQWFGGGRMNYVTNAVDRYLPERGDAIAVRWEGDDGATVNMTFHELAAEINRVCNVLINLGVQRGDRVGIFLPMLPETAVAMLACGKLGAIFVPIFSGFGADAVASRLRDAGANTLITADGFYRRGREIPMLETARQALDECPDIQHVLVVSRLGKDSTGWPDDFQHWDELTKSASADFEPADTAADDPFMIIYTSGTTGKPKGALHVHSGFPIKAAHDLAFSFDLQQDETLFWVTDLGWMMGPWAISGGLIAGGSLLLFEGTPDYPEPDRLWKLVEAHNAAVLGISPTAIRALMSQGDEWVERHPMPTLRAIGSTGEPWNPGPWMWTLEKVGRNRCPIVNYSGGTEISGGIIGADIIHPQKPCSFSGPVPGMAADVVDQSGNPVRGEVGELVIRAPWVGMTSGFWKDPERYVESYWSKIPGIWVHGDWSLIDEDGFWYILGRSDDTLNIAGKRVGPAEIESAAVVHPAVQEAAAIGIPHPIKGEAIALFVILRPDTPNDGNQTPAIVDTVGNQLGRPLRPDVAHVVHDLPRTRNAKIMRRVIRASYLGQDPGDVSALENPEALQEITALGRKDR